MIKGNDSRIKKEGNQNIPTNESIKGAKQEATGTRDYAKANTNHNTVTAK